MVGILKTLRFSWPASPKQLLSSVRAESGVIQKQIYDCLCTQMSDMVLMTGKVLENFTQVTTKQDNPSENVLK